MPQWAISRLEYTQAFRRVRLEFGVSEQRLLHDGASQLNFLAHTFAPHLCKVSLNATNFNLRPGITVDLIV
jgi:hypothetical protein